MDQDGVWRGESVKNIAQGIDGNAVDTDLIMEMRTCTSTGVAHIGDELTPFDPIPFFDSVFAQMGIAGDNAVAVIDHDVFAIAMGSVHRDHPALGAGIDGGSLGSGNVQSLVEFPLTRERGFAVSEFGSQPPFGGPDGRGPGQDVFLFLDDGDDFLLAQFFEFGIG